MMEHIREQWRKLASSGGTIYRGYKIDFPRDVVAQIEKLTAPPMEDDQIDQHLKLGPILLHWMEQHHWESGMKLGRHWTTAGLLLTSPLVHHGTHLARQTPKVPLRAGAPTPGSSPSGRMSPSERIKARRGAGQPPCGCAMTGVVGITMATVTDTLHTPSTPDPVHQHPRRR